jgi:hypothetical protein
LLQTSRDRKIGPERKTQPLGAFLRARCPVRGEEKRFDAQQQEIDRAAKPAAAKPERRGLRPAVWRGRSEAPRLLRASWL